MKFLLDTHTFYWWLYFPELIPVNVQGVLSDRTAMRFVSAVSAYEMSYKFHRGRWPEIASLVAAFEKVVEEEDFLILPLTARHAVRAGEYPSEHRDPFDRLLAGQAALEGMTIVSADESLRLLGAEPLWRP